MTLEQKCYYTKCHWSVLLCKFILNLFSFVDLYMVIGYFIYSKVSIFNMKLCKDLPRKSTYEIQSLLV